MSPFAGHAALARRPALVWLTRAAVAALVVAALFTHALRSRRERQLDAAHTMLERGEYAAALRAADIADGWPAPSGPGRTHSSPAVAE